MPRRHSIAAAVLAVALGATLGNNALAVWNEGDFITYGQAAWGDDPTATNVAGLLFNNLSSVYARTGGLA
jgi:hypothetical protein